MNTSTGYNSLPQDDFEAGFRVGFEAVNGKGIAPIVTPPRPLVPTVGFTPFLMGVRTGIEYALDVDDLEGARRER